jgi:predicted extracellular nuclease
MKRVSQALEVRRLVDQILDGDAEARIVVAGDFNAAPAEVPVLAIRGDVEDTSNGDLAGRVVVPIEHTIPGPARYTLYHQGWGQMLDHMLVNRNLLAHYRGSEIHNELLHDESVAFAVDRKYQSPTTHRWSPRSTWLRQPESGAALDQGKADRTCDRKAETRRG